MTTGWFWAQAAQQGTGGVGGMLIPMVLVFGLFYFMMIRPQQRKEKERLRMIAELRAGERVMFAGGLIGTISEARETTFVVEIAPKVMVEVARGAVTRVLKEGDVATLEEGR
ncbi:MAG TPA: preprotein translocase subunit YajC [Kiritimatiellia bacterium]|jgi:preprotein translocase subunit YajC|nr:preprotein translocase subunit YajC [Kiritimatiellia bacterium]HOM59095.1 preprotein translocase subunit YajC [Kiritimatiellia bacterium]HOR96926.1 preprotein translocase subunit YajC [Kiritimatiellia bacterium]HPC49681.1 preprotein translocase subunit YajC [Kiritimatiellia bacterium]HPK36854.1 preprotein translocase subunit YajC [Kiritimatiellia bacterium]